MVMIAVVLRRFGWAASITGGVLLTLSFPAVYGNRSALLETVRRVRHSAGVGSARPRRRSWAQTVSFYWRGLAAGMACDMKAWYIGPLLALLLFAPSWAARWRFVVGSAATIAVVYLPFFLQAPNRMFTMLILDQLGRPHIDSKTFGVRMRSILGVGTNAGDSIAAGIPAKPVVAVLLIVTVFLALLLLTERRSWILLALLTVNLGTVLVSPSFFLHYTILSATPLALVGGAAVGFLPTQLADKPERVRMLAAAFATIGILGAIIINWRHDFPQKPRGQQLSAAMAQAIQRVDGCVKSDDPTVLALANVVTRNLESGCEVRPDLSGMSYDFAKLIKVGEPVGRGDNPIFQRAALNYLSDSDANIRVRNQTFSYTPAVRKELELGGVIFKSNERTLYATATN